jgi:ABC-type branched-subunit amino acid transport system ATPase component
VINNPEGLVGPIHQLLDRRRQRRLEPIASETDAITAPGEPGTRRSATTSRGPDLLSINDLSVRYGGVVAVDEATFAVSQGEIVGLIGPNGAGKTTAMDALCGFVNYTGHVTFEGHPLDGLPPHRRAMAGVGRTFQGIDLYEDLSVEENVVVGQYMAKSADTEQLRAVLDLLGLSRFRERNVRELSQGQRQLISIARALAGQPRLLLLDEPAAGLDTTESAWLAERLHDVRDSGVTILLVDHDMSLVLSLCDTINVLDFGRVVARGNPTEVRNDPVVTEAYLGATHAQRQATS